MNQPSEPEPMPRRVRTWIISCAIAGAALLAVAAAGLAGVGPFGA